MTDLDADQITRLEKDAEKYAGQKTKKYHFAENIHPDAKEMIEDTLRRWSKNYNISDWKTWETEWNYEKFFKNLRMVLNIDAAGNRVTAANSMDLLQRTAKAWTPCNDPRSYSLHLSKVKALKTLAKDAKAAGLIPSEEEGLTSLLVKTIKARWTGQYWGEHTQPLINRSLILKTIPAFTEFYNTTFTAANELFRNTEKIGNLIKRLPSDGGSQEGSVVSGSPAKKSRKERRAGRSGTYNKTSAGTTTRRAQLEEGELEEEAVHGIGQSGSNEATTICHGCGRGEPKHAKEHCRWKEHPNFNNENKDWADSTMGKAWESQLQSSVLRPQQFLNGVTPAEKAAWNEKLQKRPAKAERKQTNKEKGKKPVGSKGKKSESSPGMSDIDVTSLIAKQGDFLLPIHLLHLDGHVSHHRALIDTGARDNNYIDRSLESLLEAHGAQPVACKSVVNGAIAKGGSSLGSKRYELTVRFYNEKSCEPENLSFSATSIDLRDIEIFIGRPLMQTTKLIEKVLCHLNGEPIPLRPLRRTVLEPTPSDCWQDRSVGTVKGHPDQVISEQSLSNTGNEGLAGISVVEDSKLFLDPIEATDGIDLKETDTPWQRVLDGDGPDTPSTPRKVFGSDEEKRQLNAFLEEFEARFSLAVSPEPARVPPLELDIDVEKWRSSRVNQGNARTVSHKLQPVIKDQTDSMQGLSVIQVSTADRHSQVLMVPKPHTDPPKWRMCNDYVFLNSCTRTQERWPLPIIPEMIQRIGRERPKYFAKMDFTSGYHQAPMSAAARIFTAFICWCGLFEWLRVPMGLKGAPSYFQRVMATIVLAGLIWIHGVELYLDDLLVHATTFPEYMTRLRKVFERLEKHNITLNPTKCEFGLSEVEYVGYVINEQGYTLSEGRKEAVFQIPRPTVGKHMKSFIGVANYFRNHIPDFGRKIAPLNAMIQNYDRTRSIAWTEEAEMSWNSIREAIRQCQTLHFVRTDCPIFLHTDASDYGIGGYLFQVVDDVEVPVAFMSKSLTEAESRWSVTEKECYAFVYMFKKYEYLLRDTYFILRTDHRNLTYVNESASPKVRRWKLLISEFDFGIEYLRGEDNIVADAQSRLLARTDQAVDTAADGIFAAEEQNCDIRHTELGTQWGPRHPNSHENARAVECTEHWAIVQALAALVEIESPELREQLHAKWEEVKIPSEQYKIIGKHHNSIVGHHGVERTLEKLRAPPNPENGYRPTPESWVQMREHVKKFIQTCPCCQKMSRIKVQISTRGFTTASEAPMTRVSIDTLELPEDEEGYNAVVVIIDSFTRWVEMYACRGTGAAEAVRALISYIQTFGQPSQLLSDNGAQYASDVVAELCKILGTEHVRTIPHSHQENAIVERVNKEILRHLRALVYDDKTIGKWSKRLVFVQRILNTTVHESIGVAPCQLLFGNSIQLDSIPFLPISSLNFDGRPLSNWADEMLRSQDEYMRKASQIQAQQNEKHMLERTKHLELTPGFLPGDWVKVMHPPTRMGWRPPNKLLLDWKGPFKVLARYKGEYELWDPTKPDPLFVSEHLVERYHVDEDHSQPIEEAIKGSNKTVIEQVLDVRGTPRRKSTIKLLIKWSDEPEPQWFDWNSSFLHEAKMHNFFMQRRGPWLHLVKQTYRDQYEARQANAPAADATV